MHQLGFRSISTKNTSETSSRNQTHSCIALKLCLNWINTLKRAKAFFHVYDTIEIRKYFE